MSVHKYSKQSRKGNHSRPPQPTPTHSTSNSDKAENILELQRTIGNRAVIQLVGADTPDSNTSDRPMLRYGARSNTVTELQSLLNQNGANLEVDGIFGQKTYQAVLDYQSGAGLAADGIVGPLTWGSLLGSHPDNGDDDTDVPTEFVQHLRFLNTLLQQIGGSTDTANSGSHSVSAPSPNSGWSDNDGDSSWGDAIGAVSQFVQDTDTDDDTSNNPNLSDIFETIGGTDTDTVSGMPEVMQAVADMIPVAQQARTNGDQAFQPALDQLDHVIAQVNGGQGVTTDLVTALGVTTTEILTAANQLQTPGPNPKSFAKTAVTKTTTWKSNATTIGDLAQDVDVHQSIHGEAAHVAPQKPKINYGVVDGKISDIQLTLDLHMDLPEWTQEAAVGHKCPCWQKEWDRLFAAISAHEPQHVAIFPLPLHQLPTKRVG